MAENRRAKQPADGGWRPVLRRMDQAAVAALLTLALAGMGVCIGLRRVGRAGS